MTHLSAPDSRSCSLILAATELTRPHTENVIFSETLRDKAAKTLDWSQVSYLNVVSKHLKNTIKLAVSCERCFVTQRGSGEVGVDTPYQLS